MHESNENSKDKIVVGIWQNIKKHLQRLQKSCMKKKKRKKDQSKEKKKNPDHFDLTENVNYGNSEPIFVLYLSWTGGNNTPDMLV